MFILIISSYLKIIQQILFGKIVFNFIFYFIVTYDLTKGPHSIVIQYMFNNFHSKIDFQKMRAKISHFEVSGNDNVDFICISDSSKLILQNKNSLSYLQVCEAYRITFRSLKESEITRKVHDIFQKLHAVNKSLKQNISIEEFLLMKT